MEVFGNEDVQIDPALTTLSPLNLRGELAFEDQRRKLVSRKYRYTLLSEKALQILNQYLRKYSFATHPLEAGTDLRYIQELLKYSHSKTAEIYTHVSTKSLGKIMSPLDTIKLFKGGDE